MSRIFLPLAALLSVSCLFETEDRPRIPLSTFDLSRLGDAANPLSGPDTDDSGKSLVGLQFAFRSMEYAREVDSNVEAFHAETGKYPALVGAYFDLSSRPEHLQAFLDAVDAKGAVPYVTLDPKDWDEPDMAYQRTFIGKIIRGDFDTPLRALARTIKDFDRPVLLRFAHEMNGEWYPYAGGGDFDGDRVPDGPGSYIEAWRRVHDLFSDEAPAGLFWAFCPNAEDFPPRSWNRPFQYYPGPEYVDFIFVDAYEHHDKRTQSLESAMAYFYNELGLFLESRWVEGDTVLKPFGLGEFGTNRADKDSKAEWYSESLAYIAEDRRIRFHALYNGRNGKEDFSIAGLGAKLKSAYANARFQFQRFNPPPSG